MKTAVSIPDDVFDDAERLADRLQTSRSQLYARALSEFVARHDEDRVTAKMNEVIKEIETEEVETGEVEPGRDEFSREAARQTLRRVPW